MKEREASSGVPSGDDATTRDDPESIGETAPPRSHAEHPRERRRPSEPARGTASAFQQLEHELKATREDLQATIEEFARSREELQSLNEELSAVHTQLEEKVAEVEKVNDRERQLRLVTDAMPVLIAYCDRDMVYQFCNARYEEWFGLKKDQVIGKRVEDVIGSGPFETVRPHVERVLAGRRVSFEARIPYRHGPLRHVHIDYVPHTLRSGVVVGYYAMIEDVSGRVEYQQLSARLAAIVEHSNDAIIGKDLQGRVTSWNSAAARMYGYSAEEMVGQPLELLLPDDRKHEVKEIIERVRRGEAVSHYETVRRARGGREVLVDLTTSPICDADGELTGISAIVRDITDRQERERLMREKEARLRMAKQAAGLGIYDFDLRNGTVEWDDRIREIWGVGEDDEITHETFLSGVHPDDRSIAQAAAGQAFDPAGGGQFHAEYRVVQRGTEAILWVSSTGLVTFEDGEAVRLVGTVLDVTESRRLLESLEIADRRKDEFLATLGHELRNPLAAIVNTVECLRADDGARGPEELYEIMARQTGHMSALMNDLLDIGRITRGDVQLRLQRLTVADHIGHALDAIRLEIDSKGHRLEVTVEPSGLELVADPVRLEQIIINLLSNAAKYTPDPGVIELRAHATDDAVEFVVRDTGVGFTDAEQAKRVFDLFYQARKGSGGLGIGLCLVRSLVDLHGGTVTATSDGPGLGSTLRVRLPRSLSPDASGSPARERGRSADLRELRVLAVDDHQDALSALQLLLADECDVRIATTGAEALDEGKRFRPQVLLLDLALPDMSGFEIAAAAREMPELRDAVMIAMTGFGDSGTYEQVVQAGFYAHLLKPVDIQDVIDLLQRIVVDGLAPPT